MTPPLPLPVSTYKSVTGSVTQRTTFHPVHSTEEIAVPIAVLKDATTPTLALFPNILPPLADRIPAPMNVAHQAMTASKIFPVVDVFMADVCLFQNASLN